MFSVFLMFVILQKYDFSSKSQRKSDQMVNFYGCLWYCKSTIFQANHNITTESANFNVDVCDTAKVRFFKQITTEHRAAVQFDAMFVILQKYDFSSKSQLRVPLPGTTDRCLWYCKSTIFQANHNWVSTFWLFNLMFVILQKYDFSSKSQHIFFNKRKTIRCLWYCKSTIFQANHNKHLDILTTRTDVCDTAKVRFFKQITTLAQGIIAELGCLWYCKSTIFQANHNSSSAAILCVSDVCDTAKVRFFKQITTPKSSLNNSIKMFVILQKYDFSSKSQHLPIASMRMVDVCDTAKVRFFKQITTGEVRSWQPS